MSKLNYSVEMAVFCSIFYYCSPKGYRMLRNSGRLILPSYSTVKRLTYAMKSSPEIEQQDAICFFYIKHKFKYLSSNDKFVTLMVDEIHIKQYFDYKCGSVVGTAYDSIEAASSAFVFMLNSVLSKYK